MNIQLPPRLEEIVREKVASGRYHDATEVLSEALIALDNIERGDYALWTPELREEIKREARQMVEDGREPNPDVRP